MIMRAVSLSFADRNLRCSFLMYIGGELSCYNTDSEMIELDHQYLEYGSVNTTLAWKISSKYNDCNISKIQSHPPCLPNNVDVNDTILYFPMQITISTEKLYISGNLADFNLNTGPAAECPQLLDTVKFNGKCYILVFILHLLHCKT